MLLRVPALAFFLAGAMFAQLDSNTITVSASRNLTQQADQVLLGVSVTSGVGTSLSDVISALQPLGITAANFTGVNSGSVLILDPLGGSSSALAALQNTLTQNKNGLRLSFFVSGTQVSPQLQQMQTCPVADLVADARSNAQALASAAGVTVGQIVAMSVSNVCSLTVEFGIVRF